MVELFARHRRQIIRGTLSFTVRSSTRMVYLPRAVYNGTLAPVTGSQGGISILPRVVIPRGGKFVQSTVDRAGLW